MYWISTYYNQKSSNISLWFMRCLPLLSSEQFKPQQIICCSILEVWTHFFIIFFFFVEIVAAMIIKIGQKRCQVPFKNYTITWCANPIIPSCHEKLIGQSNTNNNPPCESNSFAKKSGIVTVERIFCICRLEKGKKCSSNRNLNCFKQIACRQ